MKQTNIIDLGKVGITVEKNLWNSSTFYERLTMVHHKESGNTYVSVEDNVNRDPSKDDGSNWILASSNGLSIYELMVARGKYTGTEEQFLADYNKVLSDATAAATTATAAATTANTAKTAALAAADEANEAKAQAAAATKLCEDATANAEVATTRANAAAANAEGIKTSLDNFIAQGGGATDAQVIKNTDDIATLRQQVIYDVTVNNDGSTFGSLSALLSDENLSTIIPTSVRHGGMSIRFVQSTDNKYVQYRYIGTDTTPAFFANVANWQDNDLNKIEQELGEIDGSEKLYDANFVVGHYIEQDCTIQASSNWGITTPILLHKGQIVKVKSESVNFCIIAETDSNGSSYSPLVVVENNEPLGLKEKEYTAQADIYVALCAKVAMGNVEVHIDYPQKYATVEDLAYTNANVAANETAIDRKIIYLEGVGANAVDAGVDGNNQWYYNNITNKVVLVKDYDRGIIEQVNPSLKSLYIIGTSVYVYNGSTLIKDGEEYMQLYDKTALTTGYYYFFTNGALWEYGYWNATPLIEIDHSQKYHYSGYSKVGGTTGICFYKDNNNLEADFISSVLPITGSVVELEIPEDAKYVGFSIHDDDVDSISIWSTEGVATIDDANNAVNKVKVTYNSIKSLPDAKKKDVIIVDKPFSGLAFSDGDVFRWAKDNNLVISASVYKTTKVSDGAKIAGVEEDTVQDAYSMTKLLSAFTAERYCSNNWDSTIELNARDCHWDFGADFIKEGDIATLTTLINASIIISDNNAAQALARAIGYIIAGDTSISHDDALYYFRKKMQETATLVGMTNSVIDADTHAFSGLKTTPTDMCKLLAYIYNNSTVVKGVWGKLNYTVSVQGNNARSWQITSTTTQVARILIPEFVGGKTGSSEAKGTYGIVWQTNNVQFASCLMNFALADGDRFQDMRHIIDEAEAELT